MSKRRSSGGPFRDEDSHWYDDDQMPGDYRPQDHRSTGWGANPSRSDDAASGLSGSIRQTAGSVGEAVSGAASGVRETVSELTARLSEGLDDLSEEAKARVVSARRAAHEARESSAAVMAKGSRAATGFFEDQPLVIGALAVALGAALGGALPRSKLEDETLGDSSDKLFADAQALFREERDKAMAAVRTAAMDAKGEIKDMGADLADLVPDGKTVGNVIVDRAADAANRVYDRATGDVEHQKRDQSQT